MIKAYALTDVGRMRSVNQDYVYCTSKPVGKLPNLYIVADGMGGHKAGDLASRFSVQSFTDSVKSSDSDNPITIISDAIKYTNSELLKLAATSADYTGMGTTFVIATVLAVQCMLPMWETAGYMCLEMNSGRLRETIRLWKRW